MLDWLPPEWFAALTSSAGMGVVGFLLGTYYKARIEKRIQHNLDVKLEALRASFRKEEETLRADLRAKGEQLAALRSGVLSGVASRQTAIGKRRLKAIERLWAAVVAQHQFKPAAKMSQTINMDVAIDGAAEQTAEGAAMRKFADVVWTSAGLDKLKPEDYPVGNERPFLPPMVWALFSAYSQVLSYPPVQLATMRTGVGSKLLADPKPMLDLVKSVLPQMVRFIEEHGTGGLPFLVDDLEEALLKEIQRSLLNPDADRENLEQTAAILKAVDKLAESTQTPVEPPPARIAQEPLK